MRVERYVQVGGATPALAAVRGACVYHRILSRQTSSAPGEALLFAVAGGIGISARVEGPSAPRLALDFSAQLRGGPGELIQVMCVRLGIPASFRHLRDTDGLLASARRALSADEPLLLLVHAGKLAHLACPDPTPAQAVHVLTLVGLEEGGSSDSVLVADLEPAPVHVPLAELIAAWEALSIAQRVAVTLAPPAAAIDLPKAIEAGLRVCSERLLDPPHPRNHHGVPALGRLAEAVGDPRDAMSWGRVFPPGAALYGALKGMHMGVQHGPYGEGAGRALFATALREAGAVVQGPDFGEVVDRYESLALAWTDLAQAALPAEVDGFAQVAELVAARDALVRDGAPLAQRLQVQSELGALEAQLCADFPLDDAGCRLLLGELQERLLGLQVEETAAARALRLVAR